MRTETELGGKEMFCVWVKEAAKYLSMSGPAFTTAVRESGIGKTQEKRDFLKKESKDDFIKKTCNSCRQNCVAVYLCSLPVNLAALLKASELYKQSLHH